MSLRALVVGLGRVGMGFDLALPPSDFTLTHARAFERHSAFELIGAVDTDSDRRRVFEAHYRRPAYPDIASAVSAQPPDVVALAVPAASHAPILAAVLEAARPRAVLCEKPMGRGIDEARRMTADCARAGVSLFVNYTRRSEPGALEVKKRILDGRIGTPVKGVVWYSKGMFNTASHFLNLLEDWLGDVVSANAVAPGDVDAEGDLEPDLQVVFRGGIVYFIAAREKNFSHRCLELIAPNGRLRYEAEGTRIEWHGVTPDPVFPGYRILSTASETITTDAHRSAWHVVDQIASDLAGRPCSVCRAADALKTSEVLSDIESLFAEVRR